MSIKKRSKKIKATATKPWAERRIEVLARARAVLQERVAAGRAALEPEPGVPEEVLRMPWKEAAKQGPFGRSDSPVTTVISGGRTLKWKSRKAATRLCAEAVLRCSGTYRAMYAALLANLVIGKRVARPETISGE